MVNVIFKKKQGRPGLLEWGRVLILSRVARTALPGRSPVGSKGLCHSGTWRQSLLSRGRGAAKSLRQGMANMAKKRQRQGGWIRTKGRAVGGEVSATD